MYAAFDISPLWELYNALQGEIDWMVRAKPLPNFPWGKELNKDNVFKLILQNNGCAFANDPVFHENTMTFDENYKIIFLYGGTGNNVNNYFDYVEFFGAKTLVIFMDNFLDIDKKLETEDELFIGKSLYVEMIRKITDVFLASTVNFAELNSSILSTTAAGNAYRFAGIFIAAKIIQPYCKDGEITENDIDTIDIADLKQMLKIPIELLVSGVKYMS